MFAQDLSFGSDDNAFRVGPHAHRPVGEGGGYAVPVALEGYQAGRGYPLGMLDEAVERPPQRHQAGNLGGMHIGDGPGQNTMLDLAPLHDALRLEPGIERIDIREGRHYLPQSPPCILNVLLDLALFCEFRGHRARRSDLIARGIPS